VSSASSRLIRLCQISNGFQPLEDVAEESLAPTGTLTRVRQTTRASQCSEWVASVSVLLSLIDLATGRAAIIFLPCASDSRYWLMNSGSVKRLTELTRFPEGNGGAHCLILN